MVKASSMKKILLVTLLLLLAKLSFSQIVIQTDEAIKINTKSKEFHEYSVATTFSVFNNSIFIETKGVRAQLTYNKTSQYIDVEKNQCYKFYCRDITNVACEVIYVRKLTGDYVVFQIQDIKIVYTVLAVTEPDIKVNNIN